MSTSALPLTQSLTTCFLCSYQFYVFLLLTQLVATSIMYILSIAFSIV